MLDTVHLDDDPELRPTDVQEPPTVRTLQDLLSDGFG